MKKYQKLIALLCAALILCSCNNTENSSEKETESTSGTIDATTTAAEIVTTASDTDTSETTEKTLESIAADLPRMDGSTSAAPLEIGLKSGFLDISYEQAKELVSHTTTHDSFKRLLNGEVDLIFSVPISEEQQKMADEAGVTLFMEPVAREGFVFVVNAENPVDSLTSEQLRKIYSGEITNWSEVGGNDEPIIPYQRNTDSGSQNYMTVFMGDTPLLPPKKEYVQGMMMSLMDAIAIYDNSAGAVGYSVFSYAAQMYENGDKVKYIAVDGVKPTKATMADGSYPLLSCTYIIYTDKSPDSAREFTEKVLSDEGQGYVLDSGYLPVNDMEVPEKYLPYEALGTGEPKSADFAPSLEYSELFLYEGGFRNTEDDYYDITFLKDETLQSKINTDLHKAMDELREHYDDAFAEEVSGDGKYGITLRINCRNGYLSLLLGYLDHSIDADPMYGAMTAFHYAVSLNYDLLSGEKIERFSDLFYEGENFLPDINKSISDWINQELLNYSDIGQKLDFSGILGEPRVFTIDGIVLEADNLFFTQGPLLHYTDKNQHGIVSQYRDMKDIIDDSFRDRLYDYPYNEWETRYVEENGDIYIRTVGSLFHTEEEVKAEDEFWYSLQKRAWAAIRAYRTDAWYANENVYHADIRTFKWDGYYSVGYASVGAGEEPSANFDADTLELITMDMLAGENWRTYVADSERYISEANYIASEWFSSNVNYLNIFAYPDEPGGMIYLQVPIEEVNKKYLWD